MNYQLGFISRGKLVKVSKGGKIHIFDQDRVPVCGCKLQEGAFRVYSDRVTQANVDVLECARCKFWFSKNKEMFPETGTAGVKSIWD